MQTSVVTMVICSDYIVSQLHDTRTHRSDFVVQAAALDFSSTGNLPLEAFCVWRKLKRCHYKLFCSHATLQGWSEILTVCVCVSVSPCRWSTVRAVTLSYCLVQYHPSLASVCSCCSSISNASTKTVNQVNIHHTIQA